MNWHLMIRYLRRSCRKILISFYIRLFSIATIYGLLSYSVHAESAHFSEEKSYRHWGREDGLPDDAVTALLQTHDGYLWVGTAGGLVRFDGVRFKTVALRSSFRGSNAAVTSLCEDDTHRLWIGTANGGLFWFRDDIAHPLPAGYGSPLATVNSLAVDRNACLWVGAPDGLRRLDLKSLSFLPSLPGLAGQFVTSVNVARSGAVWITTHEGMIQYRDGKLTPVDFQAEALNRSPEPIGIYEDLGGNLWAFGDTYLVNMNEGKRFNYFRTGGASSLRIWSLCEGRHGQLWIGTSGQGLFSFADGRFRPLALREGRLPSDVRAICEDNQENLWLGTYGGGLIRLRSHPEQVFDRASGLPDESAVCITTNREGAVCVGFKHAGLFSVLGDRWQNLSSQRLITSVGFGPDSEMWLGTYGDGLLGLAEGKTVNFSTASSLASDIVTAVVVQSNSVVWAGTSAGTIHRLEHSQIKTFDSTTGLADAAISALLLTRSETVWAGTATGEIYKLNDERFERVKQDSPLHGAKIVALDESADGRLWIGTEGRGIACLASNEMSVWDVATGFPDNHVFGVLADTNDTVWAATGKGIFRLEGFPRKTSSLPPRARLILEGDSSGRQYQTQGFPSACRGNDGRLWFLLPGRVITLDPREVPIDPPALPVYLEQISVNGNPIAFDPAREHIKLPPNLTALEIQFTALDLAEPERLRFQHKLDGFDADWIESSTERRVRYGRLPYGNYTFHLRAAKADGIWNDASEQTRFTHPEPVWRSAAAIFGYLFVALLGGALIFRTASHRRLRLKLSRISQQQAIEKERMRIAQNMHDELGSKLTKISYLTELAIRNESTSKESVQLIANTSRDLLQTLDEIVWAVNPRNDSLEHLAAYLGHYATEYLQNTPIDLRMELASDLPPVPLSAETRHNLFLAFQEALGNLLKHAGATQARVSMRSRNGKFTITIQDNGCGFDLQAAGNARRVRGGNGLQNMRQRLADIGGECAVQSAPDQGVTVTLSIGINPNSFKST